MGDNNVVCGQVYSWVSFRDLWIVPFRYFSEVDSRKRFRSKVQFLRNARNVVRRNVSAEYCREMQYRRTVFHLVFLELVVRHRSIAGAEVYSAICDLFYSSARSDRLVVNLDRR